MNNFKQSAGFTLIEILAVISLISITLFVVLPHFPTAILTDSTKKTADYINLQAKKLRADAIQNQQTYIMFIDISANRIWVYSNQTEAEAALEESKVPIFELPEDLNIMDVEFPGKLPVSSGEAQIYFYKKGYSDMAAIHVITDDNEKYSFMIEPFLQSMKTVDGYVSYE